MFEIQNGAIFIADAHENGANRAKFAEFLREILKGSIKTEQLFLMGDMFDFVAGGAAYSQKTMKETIELLQSVCAHCEVFYFEGNHDFNLSALFPKMRVFERRAQPAIFKAGDKTAAISHGDLYVGSRYDFYTALIRNRAIAAVFNALDFKGWLSKLILKSQKNKLICRKIEDFRAKIEPKIPLYPKCDMILEGHYHQNARLKFGEIEYINFAAFGCEGLYHRFEDGGFGAVEV